MVFKRRDKRNLLTVVSDFFWPRGGWRRAAIYVKHRLHRLPDPPHRIARGIFAGVFVTFSPFFGLHFLGAALVALIMRGNILAALLATFVGNPLTFLAIGTISFQAGHFLLGSSELPPDEMHRSFAGTFVGAGEDLKQNVTALFTDADANWDRLRIFYDDIFFPYMVGGFVAGIVAGIIAYYLTLPVLQVYQSRRKRKLKAKWLALKEKAAKAENATAAKRPDR